jgi:hypothetical protein
VRVGIAERLWGVRLDARPDRAVVCGFDQSPAATLCMYAFLAVLLVSVPVVMEAKQRLLAAGILGAVFAAAVLFSQFLRFRVILSAAGVELERSWAGIRYARFRAALETTAFRVWGTGDWGMDGSWPMREFCEISPQGTVRADLALGTPRTAVAIARFLDAQKARFLEKP